MADTVNKVAATGHHEPPVLPANLGATVARFHAAGWAREAARLAGDAPGMARWDVELERLGRAIDARTPAD